MCVCVAGVWGNPANPFLRWQDLGKQMAPQDPDEDVIVIHLGHLTDEQFERVQQSIIVFMNARWPNVANIGIDS